MALPLANVTRSTITLARKSALLAHISSSVTVTPNVAPARALTSSGAGPSVSSLSSATFLGASLAARKLVESSGEKKSAQDGESSEVHGHLKAALQKQQSMGADPKEAKEESVDPAAY